MKVRPCKRGCGYPALKGRQFCEWHALMRSSSDVQADAALSRLAACSDERISRVSSEHWPDGERWCAGCQSYVPLFYCSGSRCRACNSLAAHGARLEKVYGIDSAEYDRIFRVQGGRCGICRNRPASIRFATDHDHQTDEVRGILCKRCNHDLLGGGHDSIDVLWNALVYLIHPPAQRAEGWKPPTELTLDVLSRYLAERGAEAQQAAPRLPAPLPAPF